MSGGSLDYICYKVEDTVETILGSSDRPLHRAFAAHLTKVAIALHALEWMLSDDNSPGSEDEAIRAVLSPGDEITAATEMANVALHQLEQAIAQADER